MDLASIEFGVLNELFEAGETYTKELEAAREKVKAAKLLEEQGRKADTTKKRKRAGDSLREKQLLLVSYIFEIVDDLMIEPRMNVSDSGSVEAFMMGKGHSKAPK